MKRIIEANISWFRRLLETETEPAKRSMLFSLLREEEQKLKEAEENPSTVKKAY